jgi:prophage regulatory protein
MKRLLRLPEVESRVGLKHSEIYARIGRGEFPAQIPIGPKCVAWVEAEIDAWISARIAERDGEQLASHEEGRAAQ